MRLMYDPKLLIPPDDDMPPYFDEPWSRVLRVTSGRVLVTDPIYLADVYNERNPHADYVRAHGVCFSNFGGDTDGPLFFAERAMVLGLVDARDRDHKRIDRRRERWRRRYAPKSYFIERPDGNLDLVVEPHDPVETRCRELRYLYRPKRGWEVAGICGCDSGSFVAIDVGGELPEGLAEVVEKVLKKRNGATGRLAPGNYRLWIEQFSSRHDRPYWMRGAGSPPKPMAVNEDGSPDEDPDRVFNRKYVLLPERSRASSV